MKTVKSGEYVIMVVMKKKILVTGGTGYIGSHAVVELISNGYEVEILDNLYNSKIEVLDKIEEISGVRPKFYEVDMMNSHGLDEVFAKGKFDCVIHFAGLKAVAESVRLPLKYYETNIGGTVNLLKSMLKNNVMEIVFSSSATVYGDPGVPEYVETMPTGLNMANPYGETKHVIEEMLKDVAEVTPGFKAVLLRYFNPVGAHESGLLGEDPNDIPNNLMPVIMKVSTGEIPELSVYGSDYPTADGTAVRDFIHVVDLAKGHVAALNVLDGSGGVMMYNLGTGNGVSVKEMVAAFEKASGEKLPHKYTDRRDGDLPAYWANATKAKEELGWETELSVDDAMADTLKFLKKNR